VAIKVQQRGWFVFVLAFVSASGFLAFAALRGSNGFPLDDAWIHQVYARNLGTRGEFAFFAGQPSAGSTAPFWSLLLSLGYLARIEPRLWAYTLGIIFLAASAFLIARLSPKFFPSSKSLFTFYILLFTCFEWHLVWSAVSGMEILLFVFLSLLLVERTFVNAHPFALGLIAGLLTLTRPEGIVFAALVLFGAEFFSRTPHHASRLMFYALGFLIPLAPYLLFNLSLTGTILPNTFFAKNVEYAELLAHTPFFVLWRKVVVAPWIGAQILLLPGVIFAIVQLVREHRWRELFPATWIVILPTLYAIRLPVDYQHGRYEMPVIPFIILYGMVGTVWLFEKIKWRVLRRAWGISIAVAVLMFWVIGADAYARDVAVIECEMMQSARWVAANVPRDARLAAHDIGALGYVLDQPFIDLAGLVSPEVIPFLRDENRLRDFLFSRNTQYAIFFPDWYPTLARDARFMRVYQTNCALTREMGGENMTIYQIVR